ncbi:MAG: hypothetical protein Fur0041_18510 [Bacteroidia bacterium]
MKMQKHNAVSMVVNLGNDPIVRVAKNGNKSARFVVAALTPDEEKQQNPDASKIKWMQVVSWGNVADLAERTLLKGSRVLILGYHVTRTWTDAKGRKRSQEEIVATQIKPLHSGKIGIIRTAA